MASSRSSTELLGRVPASWAGRFPPRRALPGLVSALALGLVACAGEKGELVLALQTDMSLPEDVDTVNIEVKVGATPVHDGEYILDPGAAGSYRMPATLGIVAGEDANAIVEVKVTALRTVNGVREARTVNKSITTVPEDRVALLRVPIQWLSTGDEFVVALPNDGDEPVEYDTACPPVDGRPQSALAGECQDAEVSSGNLPDFEASQVYGGAEDPGSAGTCFPTEDCFDSGFTVAPLPRTSTERDCIVEVALQSDEILNFACITPMPAAGATRGGICGANDCYVPLDRDDRLGWRELALPGEGDVDTPSELRSTGRLRRYRLPTAVCDRVDSGRALGVVASTSDACAVTKTLRYPTCGPWSSVGKGGTPDFGPDADGDTFPGSESGGPDCNDRDDTIYPGAPEACDGKDNDCDGMVDDSCVMQLPFSHHVDLSGTSDFVSNARYAIYQSFTSSNPLDLDQRTVTFVPNEAGTSYAVSTGPLAWDGDEGSLLVPPSGSSDPSNCDDCYASLNLSTPFTFYGASYDVLFPSSNGYLTFVAGDSTYTESVETFLQGSPRISALFDDLDTRGDATVGDEILAFTSEEKTVVTYRNIQHFSNSGTSNTFQFALHADGTIQISYDGIEDVATGNLVGISPGSITDGGTGGTGGMTGSGGTGGAGGTGGTSGTGGSGGNAGACSFSAATVADTTYCADVAVDDVGLFQLSCVEDACQCCTSDACTPISLTPLEVCTSEDNVRSVLMSECIAGAACGEGCPVTTPGNGAACDSSTIASCTFDDGNFCECVDDSFSCAF